jgi:hypothetical protein
MKNKQQANPYVIALIESAPNWVSMFIQLWPYIQPYVFA